jgi:hypothetical protein
VPVLLIFGITIRYTRLTEGGFFCPNEGGDRRYALMRARRWFTLFFIPLIPLKELDTVVECEACGHRFDPSVLTQATAEELGRSVEEAARTLFGAIAAVEPDATVDRAVEVELGRYLGDDGYGVGQLVAHARIQTDAQSEEIFGRAARQLDLAGRESMLMAAVRAAVTEGVLVPGRRAVIERSGRALGLSPAHIEGVIVHALGGRDDHT